MTVVSSLLIVFPGCGLTKPSGWWPDPCVAPYSTPYSWPARRAQPKALAMHGLLAREPGKSPEHEDHDELIEAPATAERTSRGGIARRLPLHVYEREFPLGDIPSVSPPATSSAASTSVAGSGTAGSSADSVQAQYESVISEVLPSIVEITTRRPAMSVSTIANWAANFLVAATFLSLGSIITRQGTFFLYGAIAVFAMIFFWRRVPETKDRTLEEIQADLTRSHQETGSQRAS